MGVLLKMEHINKSFSGVKVLQDVGLTLERGEVHALLGENGAGKSTLIKILGGVYTKDSGSIQIDGEEAKISDVYSARQYGISIIHQELMLAPDLSIAENLFVGREPRTRISTINMPKMEAEAQKMLDEAELDLKATDKIHTLTIAQRQMVEIVRAISFGAKIIVMDEPTSSLSENRDEQNSDLLKRLYNK